MLDTIIINPGGRQQTYQDLNKKFTGIEPPIWAGLIANNLRKNKVSLELLDTNALKMSPEQTALYVANKKPKLVVIVIYGHNPSSSTQTMPSARQITQAIKKQSTKQKVIFVGGHVTALPRKTLQEEECDFVCTGEGPTTILKLLDKLKCNEESFYNVPSLCFTDNNGEILITKPAQLISNLDQELPGVAWDLLPMKNYRAHNWHGFTSDSRENYASIYTTLGCPFNCSFCCIQAPFKESESVSNIKNNSYRKWSPSFVLDQIDILVKTYKVKNLKIADELFIMDKKHVTEICKGLIERNYNLNIWAYSRVDTLSEEMVRLFKAAGINWVCLGIEAADEIVKKDMQKFFRDSVLEKNIRLLKDHKINIIGNFIFGLPEDTEASLQNTLQLAKNLNLDYANFYCSMPYPGSQLYKNAIKENLPLPKEWSGYSQHSYETLPLPSRNLTGPEILKFRDQAFNDYFTDPNFLAHITKKFGNRFEEEIIEITKIKLKRKYVE